MNRFEYENYYKNHLTRHDERDLYNAFYQQSKKPPKQYVNCIDCKQCIKAVAIRKSAVYWKELNTDENEHHHYLHKKHDELGMLYKKDHQLKEKISRESVRLVNKGIINREEYLNWHKIRDGRSEWCTHVLARAYVKGLSTRWIYRCINANCMKEFQDIHLVDIKDLEPYEGKSRTSYP